MNSNKLLIWKYRLDRKVLLIILFEFLLLFIKHIDTIDLGFLYLINFVIIYILTRWV